MTTPPTPAGWYPDPDGSGGQRYWDGSGWTEHRSPATPEPAEPSEPTPAAESPGSEQPTAVVKLPATGDQVGGAHRAPEPAPESEPEPVPSEQPTSPVVPPPPAEPPYAGAPLQPPPGGQSPAGGDDRRKLILWFGAACVALLAALVVVVIYGVFINKNDTIQISAGPTSTSESATPTTSADNGWGSETETASESPTAPSGSGEATDGGLTFAVSSVETAPSVQYQDAPVEKTAQGEFVIVHMTVTNTGTEPATYLGTYQKLNAGGIAYYIDDEATFYLNGGLAELNPGDSADVGIAFDVPPGTTPESIELHADPMGPGVVLPL